MRRSRARRGCTGVMSPSPTAWTGRRPAGVRQDPPRPPPGFFGTEAAGLSWLAAAEAVDVPAVLAVSDASPAFLALSWIERGTAGPSTDADLGRRLAALHRAGAPCFGREDRRTTGSRALPNEPTPDVGRVLRDVPPAAPRPSGPRRGALAPATIDDLVALAGRLDRFGGPTSPRPACTATSGRAIGSSAPAVAAGSIDPAAHGGHREFDLAMMRLFGGFGATASTPTTTSTRLPTVGPTASRSTRSPRSSSTPSSSAVATWPQPRRRSPTTWDDRPMEPPSDDRVLLRPGVPVDVDDVALARRRGRPDRNRRSDWRNLSLAVVNAGREVPERIGRCWRQHTRARILAALLADGRNDLVGDFYTRVGPAVPSRSRRPDRRPGPGGGRRRRCAAVGRGSRRRALGQPTSRRRPRRARSWPVDPTSARPCSSSATRARHLRPDRVAAAGR